MAALLDLHLPDRSGAEVVLAASDQSSRSSVCRAGFSRVALAPRAPRRSPRGPPRRGRATSPRAMTQSATACSFATRSSSTPRNARRRTDARADARGVLADARGEDERVEAAERDGHRGDRAGDAVREDVEREPRPPAVERSSSSPVAAAERRAAPTRARARGRARRRRRRARAAGRASAPGSTEPERVAIGTPSSGVKPIVVSTERPSRTAVTEQPPPRWQTTSRGTRTCSDAHCTDRPWKP